MPPCVPVTYILNLEGQVTKSSRTFLANLFFTSWWTIEPLWVPLSDIVKKIRLGELYILNYIQYFFPRFWIPFSILYQMISGLLASFSVDSHCMYVGISKTIRLCSIRWWPHLDWHLMRLKKNWERDYFPKKGKRVPGRGEISFMITSIFMISPSVRGPAILLT